MRNRILSVLLAFLFVLLGSGSAYAYPIYLPGADGGISSYGNDNYMIAPVSNAFNAALWLIGENDKYPQLTDAQLTLLSNEDTGGAFYDLAIDFSSVADGGIPSWAQPGISLDSWTVSIDFQMATGAYGDGHVWYVHADDAEIANARRDFLKVYNGEVTGDSSDYVQFAVDNVGSNLDTYLQGVTSARIPKNKCNLLSLSPSCAALNLGSIRQNSNNWYANSMTWDVTSGGTLESASNGYNMVVPAGAKYLHMSTSANYTWKLVVTGTVLDIIPSSSIDLSLPREGPTTFNVTRSVNNILLIYGGTTAGGGGDNHWPDPTPPNPPNPDPPDVPGPPDLPGPPENPTIPEPDPPEPINPYTPIVEPEPTGTTPTDYTPWLRAILAALNRIIVDLANHCQHIQNAIRNASSYVVEAIGDYSEYLAGKLHYELTTMFADLESYLADLAQWLADELDFDRDGQVYDDAKLMRLLLSIHSRLGDLDSAISDLSAQLGDIYVRLGQILAKIGSGGGSRPSTNQDVDDGFDFWQWLLDLITNKLGDIITDFVGDIGGFLEELVGKFPFSIPWDIMAYLALLDANRVTPVITFVIPAIDGWWPEQQLVIDLAPFDDAMAAVRSMMLIVWGFFLVMKTDWLGKVFDDAVQVVVGFFDRLAGHGSGA